LVESALISRTVSRTMPHEFILFEVPPQLLMISFSDESESNKSKLIADDQRSVDSTVIGKNVGL
jgi:hypothetical protein